MTDTTYRPQPGDRVLLTVRATYNEAGRYIIASSHGPYVNREDESVVGVELAPELLPGTVGAMILATVPEYASGPVLLELGMSNGSPQWFVRPGFDPVYPDQIADRWVEIDPQTLRPLGGDR